jgi:hypothetical protein
MKPYSGFHFLPILASATLAATPVDASDADWRSSTDVGPYDLKRGPLPRTQF